MSMEALQVRIGYHFNNKGLLERALTHSSYANESRQKMECNERMEFSEMRCFPSLWRITSSISSIWQREI